MSTSSLNIFEGDLVGKSFLLSAADLVITPTSKAFGGRKVSIESIEGISSLSFEVSEPLSGWGFKRVLWTVAAIASSPLAVIAFIFKKFDSPFVEHSIGSVEAPLGSLSEAQSSLDALRKAKTLGPLKGKVMVVIQIGETDPSTAMQRVQLMFQELNLDLKDRDIVLQALQPVMPQETMDMKVSKSSQVLETELTVEQCPVPFMLTIPLEKL